MFIFVRRATPVAQERAPTGFFKKGSSVVWRSRRIMQINRIRCYAVAEFRTNSPNPITHSVLRCLFDRRPPETVYVPVCCRLERT